MHIAEAYYLLLMRALVKKAYEISDSRTEQQKEKRAQVEVEAGLTNERETTKRGA